MYALSSKNIKNDVFNIARNSVQYLVGAFLYLLTFGTFSLLKVSAGLVGFLIAYNSVYQYNDLMDYEQDRRSRVKKYLKPLASGKTKREYVESYSFLLALLGLTISFYVDFYFGLLVSLVLFLNFLHSSPFTRLKETKFLLPNLFIIEFVKYSLGWFVISFSFDRFPFLLMMLLSSVYLIGYLYHKQNFKNFFDFKIKSLCVISFVLYLLCLFFYQFRLALLVPIPLSFVFVIFRRFKDNIVKYKMGLTLTQIISVCFVLSIFLLTVPAVAEVNKNINSNLDSLKDNVTKIIPEDIKSELHSINQTISEGIDKISKAEEIFKL
jgi:hypothetical protein